MTRATLLQLLAHPTALTGADVHALEQLADAFPYCQTAHLLLAKAAHDQDSMLAGQRLRRAATYAANRTRLRQLIEQAPAAEAPPAIALAELTAPAEASASLGRSELPVVPATVELPAGPVLAAAEPAEALVAQPPIILEDKPDQLLGTVVARELEPVPAGSEELIAEELPAQAPPIRPPAEAAVAHQEFGLATEEPAQIMAYRLPELTEAKMAPLPVAIVPATPWLPAFSGVPDVHYAPGEGSRLGFCLMAFAPDELLPGTSLPPAGGFFAPDALLLAHLAAHQPPALPKPTSLDLINSFLQRSPAQPRRRTPPLPAAPEPDAQADLSVRSTRAEADLASESLAKILARQGKTERAIAVYERLMVKQPEKMAYFAAQIESLRPSA